MFLIYQTQSYITEICYFEYLQFAFWMAKKNIFLPSSEQYNIKPNKATRSPEISREQVQKLTPQFCVYIYWIPTVPIYYLGKPPSS